MNNAKLHAVLTDSIHTISPTDNSSECATETLRVQKLVQFHVATLQRRGKGRARINRVVDDNAHSTTYFRSRYARHNAHMLEFGTDFQTCQEVITREQSQKIQTVQVFGRRRWQ